VPLGAERTTMDLNQIEQAILGDPVLSRLATLAGREKTPLFLVGGYIRDLLLGIHRKDYDLALPEGSVSFISEIEQSLGFRFFKVGREELGTMTYRISKPEMSMDVTVLQGRSIEDDLQRRDFTINAMAFSLEERTFHQVDRSMEDIEGKVIRSVSDRSIDQDPLRMLRAIRYLSTLDGFRLAPRLAEEILSKREKILRASGERIKMEIDRILLASHGGTGLQALRESSLLLTLFPELEGLESLDPGPYHHVNALSHTLLMIEKIPWAMEWCAHHGQDMILTQEDELALTYSALFHDLGKQDTVARDDKGRIHFYRHESFSSRRALMIMERLRFSNTLRDQVLHLIQEHMRILNLSLETKEAALKRLVHQVGDLASLLVLHTLADKAASRGILSLPRDEVVEAFCLRILELCRKEEIIHPPPLVNGRDLIELGYAPGPRVGHILKVIREHQVVGEIKTREEALKFLREEFKGPVDKG
jgi:poly(A) polymerase